MNMNTIIKIIESIVPGAKVDEKGVGYSLEQGE